MSTKEYKSEDLRFTWRILAGPAIGQLIGLMLGYLVSFDPNKFLSVWIGGAAGTGIGFWYGIYWHFKDTNRRKKKPYFTTGFIGLICNGLGIVALTTVLGGIGFSSNLDQLKALKTEQINRITVMEEFETVPLLIIDDDGILAEFSSACQDSIKYIPKVNYSPKTTFSCFIEISESFPYGLSVDILEGESNRIICTFAKRDGRAMSYHGTFESYGLRGWFDKYIVSKLQNKT